MACLGSVCEWMEYRAINVHLVKETFSGDGCGAATKKELQKAIKDKLQSVVLAQEEITVACDAPCVCIKDEVDDDSGWEGAGESRWTDTVTKGSCSLKATVTYLRQARHVPGKCYKPLPESPQPEDPGEDK